VLRRLYINIRSDGKIQGIQIADEIFKICQLADDTTLFLNNDQSLTHALCLLERFHVCTGLKLNKSKTEIFYLGNTNHRPNDSVKDIAVVGDQFKALGIFFNRDGDRMVFENLDKRFNRFKNILHIWSQLLYTTSVLYTPSAFVKKVDSEMLKFLWRNKPAKIKASTIIAETQKGGLKMPNYECMLKCQNIIWVKRLLSDTKSRWKTLAIALMGIKPIDLKCKLTVEYLKHIKTPFYLQVLQSWFDMYYVDPVKSKILDEMLWKN
jgi:hypothetical protein